MQEPLVKFYLILLAANFSFCFSSYVVNKKGDTYVQLEVERDSDSHASLALFSYASNP
jgi:hypothetical protein